MYPRSGVEGRRDAALVVNEAGYLRGEITKKMQKM